ncbi:MAG: hypothetical protein AAF092_14220 [Pseudomonadota bacterium]
MSIILWYYNQAISWAGWINDASQDRGPFPRHGRVHLVALVFLFIIPGGLGALAWAASRVFGLNLSFEMALVAPITAAILYFMTIAVGYGLVLIVKTAIGPPRKK